MLERMGTLEEGRLGQASARWRGTQCMEFRSLPLTVETVETVRDCAHVTTLPPLWLTRSSESKLLRNPIEGRGFST